METMHVVQAQRKGGNAASLEVGRQGPAWGYTNFGIYSSCGLALRKLLAEAAFTNEWFLRRITKNHDYGYKHVSRIRFWWIANGDSSSTGGIGKKIQRRYSCRRQRLGSMAVAVTSARHSSPQATALRA